MRLHQLCRPQYSGRTQQNQVGLGDAGPRRPSPPLLRPEGPEGLGLFLGDEGEVILPQDGFAVAERGGDLGGGAFGCEPHGGGSVAGEERFNLRITNYDLRGERGTAEDGPTVISNQ